MQLHARRARFQQCQCIRRFPDTTRSDDREAVAPLVVDCAHEYEARQEGRWAHQPPAIPCYPTSDNYAANVARRSHHAETIRNRGIAVGWEAEEDRCVRCGARNRGRRFLG